jgi:hypothetical protein
MRRSFTTVKCFIVHAPGPTKTLLVGKWIVSLKKLSDRQINDLRHTRVGSGANAKQQITRYFRLNYHSTFYNIKITRNGIKLLHVV